MKYLILLSVVLSQFTFAGESAYQKAMSENLSKMDSNDPQVLLEAANAFERIGIAERTKWLPYYYGGLTYVMLSFNEGDVPTREKYLEKAQNLLNSALSINSNEAELQVLQAMIYFALIQSDPMARGAEYAGKGNAALYKAQALDSLNPRVYYLQGQTLFYTPVEYGGGPDKALLLLQKASELFETFEKKSEFYPDWGKEECNRILTQIQQRTQGVQ